MTDSNGSVSPSGSVSVDCDRCVVKGPSACSDCVVTVLLGAPPSGITIDIQEMEAINALSDSGLVPPLRHVTALTESDTRVG